MQEEEEQQDRAGERRRTEGKATARAKCLKAYDKSWKERQQGEEPIQWIAKADETGENREDHVRRRGEASADVGRGDGVKRFEVTSPTGRRLQGHARQPSDGACCVRERSTH